MKKKVQNIEVMYEPYSGCLLHNNIPFTIKKIFNICMHLPLLVLSSNCSLISFSKVTRPFQTPFLNVNPRSDLN